MPPPDCRLPGQGCVLASVSPEGPACLKADPAGDTGFPSCAPDTPLCLGTVTPWLTHDQPHRQLKKAPPQRGEPQRPGGNNGSMQILQGTLKDTGQRCREGWPSGQRTRPGFPSDTARYRTGFTAGSCPPDVIAGASGGNVPSLRLPNPSPPKISVTHSLPRHKTSCSREM